MADEMRIAYGSLQPSVAGQPADDRHLFAECERRRGEGVPEVVNSPIFQAGARMDAPPGLLKVVGADRPLAGDDPGIAFDVRQRRHPGTSYRYGRHRLAIVKIIDQH